MRKRVGIFLVIILLSCGVVLTSCSAPSQSSSSSAQGSGASAASSAPVETWAVYWYMCGSNLESNDQCATDDLEELFTYELPDNVQMIIMAGGSKKWYNGFDEKSLQVYTYTSKGFEYVESFPQANMGDPATLIKFLDYCNTNYPADKRMLHFWDHGGGSLVGACNDENYAMDCLTLPELTQALAATSKTSDGSPLYEMVSFDACLMATIDAAAVVAPYAHYMVASEEIEPLDGWDYKGVSGAFAKNPKIQGDGLGRAVCDSFRDYYENGPWMGDKAIYTMSLIDLSKIGPLLKAYNNLGDEALVFASNDQKYLGSYGRAAKDADNYANSASSGYTSMMDLGDFVLIGQKEGLFPNYGNDVLKALNDCVLYTVSGELHKRAKGLACFYNYSGNAQKLQTFLTLGTSKSFNYFYEYVQKGSLSAEAVEYVKQVSASLLGQTIAPEPLNLTGVQSLEGHPLVMEDPLALQNGQWQLNVGPELGQQLSAVYLTQAWISPGATADSFQALYGMTGYFAHDFNNGVFTANFKNEWFALGNLTIYTEPYGSELDKDYYTSPVQINGERYTLLFSQNTKNGALELLGAMLPIDPETGMAGKELYQLQDGDKIEAIMYILLPEGKIDSETGTRLFSMPLGEITYDSSTKIRMRSVSGSEPGYWETFVISFVMVDFAGNIYFSDYGYYIVSGGEILIVGNS